METNRKDARFGPVLIRAQFRLDEGGDVHEAYATNLSRGGAFLATRESIPLGTPLALRLSLPWQLGQIDVQAQAKWCRPEDASSRNSQAPGLGLAFTNLDQKSIEKIEEYLDTFQALADQLPSTVC